MAGEFRVGNTGMGNVWEKLAVDYLSQRGVKIIVCNFKQYRAGEIDIVGLDGGVLVFFEVKYRKNARNGYPQESVTKRKIRSICRASDYFRLRYQYSYSYPCRFDVIAILGEEIFWYKSAFDYIGKG